METQLPLRLKVARPILLVAAVAAGPADADEADPGHDPEKRELIISYLKKLAEGAK